VVVERLDVAIVEDWTFSEKDPRDGRNARSASAGPPILPVLVKLHFTLHSPTRMGY
jgi:hypothetical protein